MTVNLTDLAKSKIEEIANECGEPYSVRLKLIGGGCASMSQDMVFSDLIGELDDVFEFDGIRVIIDQFSHSLLGDFTLDFVDTSMSQGFKFLTDPKTHTSCGCGNSTGLI
jgi:iron-sulfur cluster assembly protein